MSPCGCNYTYIGPALLVLPLFLISLVNLFVAGPPLKTIVLDSAGSSFGASLPFMKLDVDGAMAKFSLHPKDEMTHFFVVTCYASKSASPPVALEASVNGKRIGSEGASSTTLSHVSSTTPLDALHPTPSGHGAATLQVCGAHRGKLHALRRAHRQCRPCPCIPIVRLGLLMDRR